MADDITWRSVAERLAVEVEDLRRRLLGLADVLPAEFLPYLDAPFNRDSRTFDALNGWDEFAVAKSDIVTEINALWQRLS